MRNPVKTKAYADGLAARWLETPKSKNPHDINTQRGQEWLAGWRCCDRAIKTLAQQESNQ